MIELDEKTLQKLHDIQLEMLIEVDRICKKHGIQYCLVGGSALGAVRHGGVIPWDDDADVGFLRSEYEKFRKACKIELDKSKFYFQDYRNTNGYRWGYGKLRRKNTLFLREKQENMQYSQGVFIDIMPFDNVPNNYLLRQIHNGICYTYRKLFWSQIGKTQSKGLAKAAYTIVNKIPPDILYRSFNIFIKLSNILNPESDRVRILTFPTSTKDYGYLRKWYTDLIDIKYDGQYFKIARDYNGYLTCKYGDYLKLPPPNKRKFHPVSAIKLLDPKEENNNEKV